MITTPATILDEVSAMLNESSTDTSTKRINLYNRATRHTIHAYKWSFRRKNFSLTTSNGVQEYNLTSVITDGDYDPVAGIFEVWNGTEKIDPINYDRKTNTSTLLEFYLTPDNKTIGFTKAITGSESIVIIYYQAYKNVVSSTTTLNISIPDTFIIPIATYTKFLVHDGKRQRYDARNAILDYQQQISERKLADGGNKAKDLPRVVPNLMSYIGFKRSYTY